MNNDDEASYARKPNILTYTQQNHAVMLKGAASCDSLLKLTVLAHQAYIYMWYRRPPTPCAFLIETC